MRALAGSAVALLTIACASAAPPSPTPAVAPAPTAAVTTPAAADTAPRTAVRLPARVATFRLVQRHEYENRALGVQLRYTGPDSLYADVYVYPGPGFDTRCDSQCSAQAFTREVAQFQADFPEMVKQKYYDSIVVVEDETLAPGPDKPWRLGHHLRLAVQRNGKPARSDFYLYYVPRYKVKVRLTYDPTPERTQAMDAFIQDLMPQVVGGPPQPPPA